VGIDNYGEDASSYNINSPDQKNINKKVESEGKLINQILTDTSRNIIKDNEEEFSQNEDEIGAILSKMSFTQREIGNTRKPQMLTVILRGTNDKTRDILRMRRIHGIIASYPGDDRFSIQINEKKQEHLVDFPNLSVGICTELIETLSALVGTENIQIGEILIQ